MSKQKSPSLHVPQSSPVSLEQEIDGNGDGSMNGTNHTLITPNIDESLEGNITSPNHSYSHSKSDNNVIVATPHSVDNLDHDHNLDDNQEIDVDNIGFDEEDEMIVSQRTNTLGGPEDVNNEVFALPRPPSDDDSDLVCLEEINELLEDDVMDYGSDEDMDIVMPLPNAIDYEKTLSIDGPRLANDNNEKIVNKPPVMLGVSVDVDAIDEDGNLVDGEIHTGYNKSIKILKLQGMPSAKKMNSKAEGVLPGGFHETMLEGDDVDGIDENEENL